MIQDYDLCRLVSKICKDNGLGQFIAVYNDIDKRWSYYVGNYKAANPSDRIYNNRIDGVDVTYLFINRHQFFNGETVISDGKVITYIDTQKETNNIVLDFDFRVLAFS